MAEQYFNLYGTTVASGGYTSGSGILNVAATSPITLNAGDSTRVLIYRVITGVLTPIVLLKVTAVNSGTQFNAVAEGSDASALSGDIVIGVMSAGAMNQIRADMNQVGIYADLPATSDAHTGDTYTATDFPVKLVYNGSVWTAQYLGSNIVLPVEANYAWLNQGTATEVQSGPALILTSELGGGDSIRGREIAYTSPGTLTVFLNPFLNAQDYNQCGIYIRDAGTGQLVVLDYGHHGVFNIEYQRFNSPTSFNSETSLLSQTFSALWLRLQDNGTNIIGSYSIDGVNFTQLFSESRTAFLTTPSVMGYYADSVNGSALGAVALISWQIA